MSLLSDLLGQVLGSLGSGQQNQLLQSTASLITQHGGLDGLKQKFESQGLGQVFSSWVGTGQNQPVTADQVTQVLGHDKVQQLAQDVGINHGDAAAGLAQILPNLVDKLTPNGASVSGNALEQGLASLVQNGLHALLSK